MDASTLVDDVRSATETPLSRLGSSKWLYALTAGEMDGDSVRAAAAADAALSARVFDEYESIEADVSTAEVFGDVAAALDSHHEAIGADVATPDRRPLHEALAGYAATDTPTRLGAFVGWALVADQTVGQMVGFFVGDADPQTANTFRAIRDDVTDARERALDRLDDVCTGDEWDAAADAAVAVVEATYDDYVETLESMGVKPKNVC